MILWRQRFNLARNSMLNKFIFLIFSQLALTGFLIRRTLHPDEYSETTFATPPPEISTVISRFVCGIFLHISQEDEIKAAFKMMKYSINHPWKFEYWFVAFLGGFCQVSILILVEVVCLVLLLVQDDVLDVLMNFISLTIITELDDYLFQTIYENPISDLIKDGEANICGVDCRLDQIIKIETTTSSEARIRMEGNRNGERNKPLNESDVKEFSNEAPPSYIYISLWSRNWLNLLCRCCYLTLRCFYVSVMFYFSPWLTLFLSYLNPYHHNAYWF